MEVAPPAFREAVMLAVALLVNVCPLAMAKIPPLFNVIVPSLDPPAFRLNVPVEVELNVPPELMFNAEVKFAVPVPAKLNVPPFSMEVIPVNVFIPVVPESIPEIEVVLLEVKVTAAVAKVMVDGTVNASATVAFPVKFFITELPPKTKV